MRHRLQTCLGWRRSAICAEQGTGYKPAPAGGTRRASQSFTEKNDLFSILGLITGSHLFLLSVKLKIIVIDYVSLRRAAAGGAFRRCGEFSLVRVSNPYPVGSAQKDKKYPPAPGRHRL